MSSDVPLTLSIWFLFRLLSKRFSKHVLDVHMIRKSCMTSMETLMLPLWNFRFSIQFESRGIEYLRFTSYRFFIATVWNWKFQQKNRVLFVVYCNLLNFWNEIYHTSLDIVWEHVERKTICEPNFEVCHCDRYGTLCNDRWTFECFWKLWLMFSNCRLMKSPSLIIWREKTVHMLITLENHGRVFFVTLKCSMRAERRACFVATVIAKHEPQNTHDFLH